MCSRFDVDHEGQTELPLDSARMALAQGRKMKWNELLQKWINLTLELLWLMSKRQT